MKQYFNYFKIPFILALVGLIPTIVCLIIQANRPLHTRTNTECTTTERVFDYAGRLSASEEQELRDLIAELEPQIGCDLIVVVLDESLQGYAEDRASYWGNVPMSQYTMIYGADFYDDHKFGFNKPIGDGIIFVDNWFREADGRVYSRLNAFEAAQEKFPASVIEDLLDDALEDVEDDPIGAYKKVVTLSARRMGMRGIPVNTSVIFVVACIITAAYLGVNLAHKKGKKTTTNKTYVKGGKPQYLRREDVFLNKTLVTHTISSNSGGGGGGGFTSAGGGSFSSGGHSR